MANPFSQKEELISLLMPCYGEDYKYFEKIFDHIEKSEYKKVETIVVFDGPQKKAETELLRVMKMHKKLSIQYATIKHAGAPAARNKAFDLSKGSIVSLVDADCFIYPESIRMWMSKFEENPHINRIWGLYDIINENGETMFPIGQAPKGKNGDVWYQAFKTTNYCAGLFPMRRDYYPYQDESLKSLQDWDMAVTQLERTNFEGTDWFYMDHHFFSTPSPHAGGISDDSHKNWIERTDTVRNKHGIPKSDIVVVSHGAPLHGMHAAEKLHADYLPMPSFKPHKYKMVYLLGFYLREGPQNPGFVTKFHMDTFKGNNGVNVVHWIGTDVWDLRHTCSFDKLKELRAWFKENKVIHLCEVDFIQKELKEVGIKAKILPIPPDALYQPMELPETFNVAVYLPPRDLYQPNLMVEVARSMPDIHFYFFGDEAKKGEVFENMEHLGYIDYDEWMPKFSCNLRITSHDGLPLTPLQFMTAGRNVVTNIPLKGSIQVKPTRKDIIRGIREAQENNLNGKVSKYWTKEMDFERYNKRMRRLYK